MSPKQPNPEVPANCPSLSPPVQSVSAPYSAFTKLQKALIVFIVSIAATFSGFASNIYFPALPNIANDLSVSVELVNLSVTCYLIFQGIAPSLWGPLSDVQGRRTAYIYTFLVFLGACVGLANTKNYPMLMILRCVQSTGSASTIAIGSGIIGDLTTRDERGSFMGVFQAGMLVPVAVGPIIGGALAEVFGWRSIFWFLTIYSAIFLVLLVLLLPETLRSIVGNGTRVPTTFLTRYPLVLYVRPNRQDCTEPSTLKQSQKNIDLLGPFRILLSKRAAPIILFLAVYYMVWQMSITAMSTLFADRYGLTESQIGLCYIANGAGSMIGTLIMGKILDMDYRRVQARYLNQSTGYRTIHSQIETATDENFPLEQARLRLIPLFAVLQCASILLFGWTVQHSSQVHIAIPITSTFITGWTAIATQSVVMTYLVDVFPANSAAASASLNLARCLFAAAGTSLVMPMANGVGVGWAFTLCAAVQGIGLVGVGVQRRYGRKWRVEAAKEVKRSGAIGRDQR